MRYSIRVTYTFYEVIFTEFIYLSILKRLESIGLEKR